MNKLFVVGLPRTGTTSLCAALLDLGYGVAHTAYTDQAFERADVIADTPVFSEYKHLDLYFPNSKFIHLSRPMDEWLPSIQRLRAKIIQKHERNANAFHPLLVNAYEAVFGRFISGEMLSEEDLIGCFLNHQDSVETVFRERPNDFLSIDITDSSSYDQLINFLSTPESIKTGSQQINQREPQKRAFPHLNSDGEISAWDKIKHPLKVSSNLVGKDGRRILSCLG